MSGAGAARPVLEVRDLHVHFETREHTVRAVNGLNLDVHAGQTLGLVGESGCGKTVTSQAILRIVPPPGRITAGSIRLHTRDQSDAVVELTSLDPRSAAMRGIRARDISIVFQEPMSSLSPVHTIGNQIVEAVQLAEPEIDAAAARERTLEMLDRVGIPRPELRIDSYTFELSGGMRQRAMIAMALVSRPQLLIADEPTTAIDVTIQAQILELLHRLQRTFRMATIIITHNLGVVAALADRVAVMYMGSVVETAATREVFHNPKHPYTRGLIASIPRINEPRGAKLWAIPGVVPPPGARIPGCPFHPRCDRSMAGHCDATMPSVTTVAEGHEVKCLLYGNGIVPVAAPSATAPGGAAEARKSG